LTSVVRPIGNVPDGNLKVSAIIIYFPLQVIGTA
jgi:hypothetical protein